MTLEDEIGFVNVVAWSRIFEQYAIPIETLNFPGVSGKLQRQDGVTHLIAKTFWDPRDRIGIKPPSSPSRDFH
jgi:error-prone DNA polymerase